MHHFYLKHYQFCPQCQTPLKNQADQLICPQCQWVIYENPAPAVVVLLIQGQKILLSQRKYAPALGDWDTPGGFIQADETAEEAAIREVKEEVNLDIHIEHYLCSLPGLYADKPVLDFVYTAKILAGKLEAKDDVAKAEWFDLNHLPTNIAFPRISQAIAIFNNFNQKNAQAIINK